MVSDGYITRVPGWRLPYPRLDWPVRMGAAGVYPGVVLPMVFRDPERLIPDSAGRGLTRDGPLKRTCPSFVMTKKNCIDALESAFFSGSSTCMSPDLPMAAVSAIGRYQKG